MTKSHTTLTQAFQIKELLGNSLKRNEDGTFSYISDENDSTIARKIDPNLNGNHVARVRSEFFGKIKQAKTFENNELKAKVEALTERLTRLEKLHAALTTTLALNKVANVRHLSGEELHLVNGNVVSK